MASNSKNIAELLNNETSINTGDINVSTNLDITGGTIRLDGDYPVGNQNVALGNTALDSLTTGNYNTAIGSAALTANNGNSNVAVGAFAADSLSGTANTIVGTQAMQDATSGDDNVAVGFDSLGSSVSSSYNVAIGRGALSTNTTSNENTAVGYSAAYANTGAQNVAIGTQALYTSGNGTRNVAIGKDSMYANTTGTDNVAVGKDSLASNQGGGESTAVGYQAGFLNTSGRITAVGRHAVRSSVSAVENTGIGYRALRDTTSGQYNTAVGGDALLLNSTSSGNTSVGYQSLYNTTNTRNTAVGYKAGYANTSAYGGVFIGYNAGLATQTSNLNTIVGDYAGVATTSAQNTFIGQGAGGLITSGAKNTVIGRYDGNQYNLDLRTSSNNIVLSDGDGYPLMRIDGASQQNDIWRYYSGVAQPRLDFSATRFGYSGGYTVLMLGQTSGNHTVSIGYDPLGNGSGGFSGTGIETLFRRGMKFLTPNSADNSFYVQFTMTDGVTSGDFNDTSDVALKENIQPISSAWDTVNQLRPVTFNWKQEGRGTRSGFVAQEVEVILPNDVLGDDYVAPDPENNIEGNSGKAINTTGIVAHLTKALQEAMERIETLEAKVAALEAD